MIFTEMTESNEIVFNETYIHEVNIGGRIREIIKQYNWKRKAKKRDYKALTENVTPYKRKEVHSKSDTDKFYKNNDYFIECVSGDEELCQIMANMLAANYDIKTPVEVYIISGKDMNKIYDLYGDNAYQNDVNHVIIPLDTLKNRKDIVSAKGTLRARYFNDVVDNNEYREYKAGRHKKSKQIQWLIDHYNESYIDDNDMNNQILAFSSNNGGSYMHDALYESYIQAKIDAEDRLAFALKESMVISEADYSNIRVLQEAKLADKIKAKWKKFIAFIKGIVARFMESMSNILLDEKEYLEKYKDTILKKKPKDNMEYSYTGNYVKGINRIINTEVPMFDYYKYRKELEAEGDGDLVQKIMSGKQFNYDDGETLSEQFKSYFLAYEDGQQEGKFSNLNMTDIYNFCYNFNKIKGVVDKDINRLEASTRAIESAINKELTATNNDAAGDNVEGAQTNTATQTTEESAIFTEKVEINDKASSDPSSKMQSTQNRDNEAEKDAATAGAAVAKSDNKEASDITNAANKWIDVCRPLIAAKLTACQQIAKDYMDIIRAHVRSYGGTDKKSKEGNKAPDKANKYSKHSDVEKAKANAERAKNEADKDSGENEK